MGHPRVDPHGRGGRGQRGRSGSVHGDVRGGVMRRRASMSPRRRWLLQSIVGLVTLPLSALPIWLYATHTSVGELLTMRARYQFLPPSTPQLAARSEAFARSDRSRSIQGVPVLLY